MPRLHYRYIHPTACIHPTAVIQGDRVTIGPHCVIERDVRIGCPDEFMLGPCCFIGARTVVQAWRMACPGGYLFVKPDVTIGGGSCWASPRSTVTFGQGCFIGERTIINCAETVDIGDEVGIGSWVGIWTHGVYPPVDQGHPARFAPITIGTHSWITGGAQILPGVSIGKSSIIAMNSVVSHNVADGQTVGGVPARVIQQQHELCPIELHDRLERIACDYNDSAQWRSLPGRVSYGAPDFYFRDKGCTVRFSVVQREVEENLSMQAEDFRDYLRRRGGIRFFTGRPFRSILHKQAVQCIQA